MSFHNMSRNVRTAGLALAAALALSATAAQAVPIERVVSPGGIEAWLVREPSIPLVSIEFAMRGGAVDEVFLHPPLRGGDIDRLVDVPARPRHRHLVSVDQHHACDGVGASPV